MERYCASTFQLCHRAVGIVEVIKDVRRESFATHDHFRGSGSKSGYALEFHMCTVAKYSSPTMCVS